VPDRKKNRLMHPTAPVGAVTPNISDSSVNKIQGRFHFSEVLLHPGMQNGKWQQKEKQ
jgi:hypothetical protein